VFDSAVHSFINYRGTGKWSSEKMSKMDAVNRYKAVGILILIALVVSSGKGQGPLENNASPKLIVGTKHIPPFAIKNPEGGWNGISIELWRQIAADLNREYELRELTLEGLLEDLRSGSINAAVVAFKASTGEAYLKSNRISFQSYDNLLDGLKAVAAGELDAMVYDAPVLRYLISNELDGMLQVFLYGR